MMNTVRTVAVSLTAITTVGRMSGVLRDEGCRELLLLRTGHRRFIPQSESFARASGLTPRPAVVKLDTIYLQRCGRPISRGPTCSVAT